MIHQPRMRKISAIGVAAALSLLGVLQTGVGLNAHAAVVLAPIAGQEPTIQIVGADLLPAHNADGTPKLGPQVGTIMLADVGKWNDMNGTSFTYQWASIASTSCPTYTTGTGTGTQRRNFVPINTAIGCRFQVTVTATNTANGDTAGSYVATTQYATVGLNGNLNRVPVAGTYVSQFGDPSVPTSTNYVAPYDSFAFLTMYGWPDNTPPSASIGGGHSGSNVLFPTQNHGQGIHTQAGGTGTYSDPITLATNNTNELWYGQEVYIPRFQKYFIAEDSCTECSADMIGSGTVTSPTTPDGAHLGNLLGPGDDGGPGLIHFDLWVGGQDGDWFDTVACEDALTWYNDDNTPYMDPIIVNPGPNEEVSPYPLFNGATGLCNEKIDGSSVSLDTANDVGPYENIKPPDNVVTTGTFQTAGLCMTAVDNAPSIGAKVELQPCDSSRADQNVSFSGVSLMLNNLCFDMGNGMGTAASSSSDNAAGVSARPITLHRCNMNAQAQWEANTDGTISDIQNSSYAFANLGVSSDGHTYLWAARYGSYAYEYWDFPFMRGYSNTAPVALADSKVTQGSTIEVSGSGLTTMTANILLVTSEDDTNGILLGLATAAPDGTFDETVTIPDSVKAGTYLIMIQGLSGDGVPIPADPVTGVSTAITDPTDTTQVPSNYHATSVSFRETNRTVPIIGFSDELTITKASSGGGGGTGGGGTYTDTGGQVTGSSTPWIVLASLVCIGGALLLFRRQSVFGTARK